MKILKDFNLKKKNLLARTGVTNSIMIPTIVLI